MKNLDEYINEQLFVEQLSEIFEDFVNQGETYKLIDQQNDYELYIINHAKERQGRHNKLNTTAYESDKFIKTEFIINAVKLAWSKIESHIGKEIKISKDRNIGFLITDKNKKYDIPLNIVGHIYDQTYDAENDKLTYKIGITTVMFSTSFKPKNKNGYKTYQLFIENLNKNIEILIIEL